MATEQCFEELEKSAAPVLVEKDCTEHGIAAERDSAEVEDSKGPAAATMPTVTELLALRSEIGRRPAGSESLDLSFEWEVVLEVVEAYTAPVKDLAVGGSAGLV